MSTTLTTVRPAPRSAAVTDKLIPEHLRAGAALWSLQASLRLLHDRDDAEARSIADERVAAADPLKSPLYGGRQALGGHGDPTGDALLLLDEPSRPNPFGDLVAEVTGQLDNVAQHLPRSSFDSLTRIRDALPAMSNAAAMSTWRLADRIDGRIRRLLGEPADRRFLPRVRCPWCDAVSLMMRLAPPQLARVVECTTCDGAWTWVEVVEKGIRP